MGKVKAYSSPVARRLFAPPEEILIICLEATQWQPEWRILRYEDINQYGKVQIIFQDDGTGRHSIRTQAMASDLFEYPVLHQAFPCLDSSTQVLRGVLSD